MNLMTRYKIQNEPTEWLMTGFLMKDSVFIDRDEINPILGNLWDKFNKN